MDINSENKFKTKCSTKTLILKPISDGDKIEKQVILPSSYKNKLRNCVIKKIQNKCIKVYSNGTIQINGVKSVNEILNIIPESEIKNCFEKYNVECILNNWTLTFETPKNKVIDLTKTMYMCNENNIIAYFQRGYPLIIKYNIILPVRKYIYDNIKKIIEIVNNGEKDIKITLMLFKSGKCICTIGGDVYNLPLDVFEKIKNIIVYENINKNNINF